MNLNEQNVMMDQDNINIDLNEIMDLNDYEIDQPLNLDLNEIFEPINVELNSLDNENVFNLQTGGANTYFSVVSSTHRSINNFRAEEYKYEIKFRTIDGPFDQQNDRVLRLFDELSKFISLKAKNNDRVRVVVDHQDLHYPISTCLVPVREFDVNHLLNSFENVCQSHRTLSIDEHLIVYIVITKLPTGSCIRNKSTRIADQYNSNNCLKQIINNDNHCALRSILIAIAYHKESNASKDTKKNLCKIDSPQLKTQLKDCIAKMQLKNEPRSIDDLKLFEQYFKFYRIVVYDESGKCIREGNKSLDKFIYLFLEDGHYSPITSIKAFFRTRYFCEYCQQKYQNVNSHRVCPMRCNACNEFTCVKTENKKCKACDIDVANDKCLEIHLQSFCRVANMCNVCGIFKTIGHVCIDQKYCGNCKRAVHKAFHKCFVLNEEEKKQRLEYKKKLGEKSKEKKKPKEKLCDTLIDDNCEVFDDDCEVFDDDCEEEIVDKEEKEKKIRGYIFFDYEATQENKFHTPNLVCALQVCLSCTDSCDLENVDCPKNCGKRQFKNNDDFCSWLFKQKYYTAIAHNMKGYDGVFLMNYIIKNSCPKDSNPLVISTGSKLLCIRFRDVRVIDSFSFMPIGLAQFPGAFGIKEMKKGFFPHLFNKRENQKYVGPYPSSDMYTPHLFSSKKKKEFDEWYEKVQYDEFDFEKEFKEYCWSDVYLLAAGCCSFRQVIMNLTDSKSIDPFENSITIASLCHLIYRSQILKPKSLPYIPEKGYNPERNFSFKALIWVKYMSAKNRISLQYAGCNGGEKQIGQYFLDGYDPINNIGYEFHGCYFHGCQKCYTPSTFNTVRQLTMRTIYIGHCKRIQFLKSKLTSLVEIWECEYNKIEDPQLDLIKQSTQEPLNPRDAMFGGRTNALRLHARANEGENINYVDFTSLYPYVQKYCEFPVGHPKIYMQQSKYFQAPSKYFGIIKCKILPPRGLYIPVLPAKIRNKLVFALCRTCAQSESRHCKHNDNDRALIGTWVSIEVNKAVSLGYKVLQIYEVWHWDKREQYDRESKKGGLFTDYINLFLKGKQESSGFPSNVQSSEEKLEYIDDYLENEGIELDINSIDHNPAKRFVFKLALNSMWGRLGMNTNDRLTCKIINNPAEWFELVCNKQYKIHSVDFTCDNVVQVFVSNTYDEGSVETSVVHAAFVTAHARLKLYSELEKLGDRVLYFDTDSIIYISRVGEYDPRLGNYLGDLTSELDNDDYIEEFVSAGPKNYGYRTKLGKTSCTVKGFTLNVATKDAINYDAIKRVVLEDRDEMIDVEQMRFIRNKHDWTVRTDNSIKKYRFVYNKRVLFDDLSTLPYGF